MIIASKILHKDTERIKVAFPYNREIALLIRQINDAKWSKTHKAWHIPYTKGAFIALKNLFPEIQIIAGQKNDLANTNTLIATTESNGEETTILPTKTSVILEILDKKIIVKMPKDDADVAFLLTFPYTQWHKENKSWAIINYRNRLDVIKNYFGDRISQIIEHKPVISSPTSNNTAVSKNEIILIQTNSRRVRLLCQYNKRLVAVIKSFPFSKWDDKNKWWTFPLSDKLIEQIEDIAKEEKLKISYTSATAKEGGVARKPIIDPETYRRAPEAMALKMQELRYSPSTIKTYVNAFEELINHYPTTPIDEIDEKQIIAFCQYLVIDRKLSASAQNTAINGIKFYYEKVLGGKRRFYALQRPNKEKALPVVLNMQEMQGILASVTNTKHKAILTLIYAAGLRISEAIRLKITDIDAQRMQIRVEQSKGKKDRYTLLSPKLLTLLRQYYLEYKPINYLFEGADNPMYSAKSIQNILKAACKKAEIKKRVTVHTLRHCFATHLLENGTDIRYIQLLMGHESSKTTEIYTHLTTKGFDQIKSPLDSLDI